MIVYDYNMKIFMFCEIIYIDEIFCLIFIYVYMGVGIVGGGGVFFCLSCVFFDELFNFFNLFLMLLCMIC